MNEMFSVYPDEFKRPKIQALTEAFEAQLDEVELVLAKILSQIEIDNAEGVALDNVGQLVGMSRQDASKLINRNSIFLLTDRDYRIVLKCLIYSHSNSATEFDVCSCIKYAFGFEVRLSTNPLHPAKIYIDSDEVLSSDDIRLINEMPWMRPAGVSYECAIPIETEIGDTEAHIDGIVGDVNTTIIIGGEQ